MLGIPLLLTFALVDVYTMQYNHKSIIVNILTRDDVVVDVVVVPELDGGQANGRESGPLAVWRKQTTCSNKSQS